MGTVGINYGTLSHALKQRWQDSRFLCSNSHAISIHTILRWNQRGCIGMALDWEGHHRCAREQDKRIRHSILMDRRLLKSLVRSPWQLDVYRHGLKGQLATC